MAAAPGRYDRVARALHWAVAVLLLAQLAFGAQFSTLDLYTTADAAWYRRWMPLHKSLGLTILLLMLCRLGWRLAHRPPPLPAGLPGWQLRAARLSHGLLYALAILQPLLGLAQSSAYGATTRFWGLFVVPAIVPAAWSRPHTDVFRLAAQDLHTVVAIAIVVLVGIHAAAALWHQFARRDGLLRRML